MEDNSGSSTKSFQACRLLHRRPSLRPRSCNTLYCAQTSDGRWARSSRRHVTLVLQPCGSRATRQALPHTAPLLSSTRCTRSCSAFKEKKPCAHCRTSCARLVSRTSCGSSTPKIYSHAWRRRPATRQCCRRISKSSSSPSETTVQIMTRVEARIDDYLVYKNMCLSQSNLKLSMSNHGSIGMKSSNYSIPHRPPRKPPPPRPNPPWARARPPPSKPSRPRSKPSPLRSLKRPSPRPRMSSRGGPSRKSRC